MLCSWFPPVKTLLTYRSLRRPVRPRRFFLLLSCRRDRCQSDTPSSLNNCFYGPGLWALRANSCEHTKCFNLLISIIKCRVLLRRLIAKSHGIQGGRVTLPKCACHHPSLHEALVLRKVELPRPVVVEDVPEDVWWVGVAFKAALTFRYL